MAAEDPIVKVRFQYLEMPGAKLDFVYHGKRYSLQSGEKYDLPFSVVEHLNSRQVPEAYWEIDESGQLRHHRTLRSRFNCQILDLGELVKPKKEVKAEDKHEPSDQKEPDEIVKEEAPEDGFKRKAKATPPA